MGKRNPTVRFFNFLSMPYRVNLNFCATIQFTHSILSTCSLTRNAVMQSFHPNTPNQLFLGRTVSSSNQALCHTFLHCSRLTCNKLSFSQQQQQVEYNSKRDQKTDLKALGRNFGLTNEIS